MIKQYQVALNKYLIGRCTRKTKPGQHNLLWRLGNLGLLHSLARRSTPSTKDAHVIIHAPNHLGDCVMSLPFVKMMVRNSARVSIVTRQEYSLIWQSLDAEVNIVPYQGWNHSETRRLRALLKSMDVTLAYLLATGMEVAWLYMRSGVRHRIGFDYWGRGFLLTSRIKSFGEPTHHSLVKTHFANNLKRLPTDLPYKYDVTRRQPIPLLRYERLGDTVGTGLTIGLALGGNTTDKRPPLNFWLSTLKLANKALQPESVYLFGNMEHRELGEGLRWEGDNIKNTCGKTSIDSLMKYLNTCDLVISPDSGIAHLAATLGVPVIVLFTSGSPSWTLPIGNAVYAITSVVPCSPCYNRDPCLFNHQCAASLNANLVSTGLRELSADIHNRRKERHSA